MKSFLRFFLFALPLAALADTANVRFNTSTGNASTAGALYPDTVTGQTPQVFPINLGTGSTGAGQKFLSDDRTYKTIVPVVPVSRGAIVMNGIASTGVSRDAGSQIAFGASAPACYSIFFTVPAANPAANLGIMGQSDTARNTVRPGAIDVYLDTSRNLICRLYGATTGDYRQYLYALTAYASDWVGVFWDVRGSKLYINGAQVTPTETTAGSAPAWAAAITGTIYSLGARGSSEPFIGALSAFSIWNYQPSAALVTLLYKQNGNPPDEWKFGSPDVLNTATFTGPGNGTYTATSWSVPSFSGYTEISANNGVGFTTQGKWYSILASAVSQTGGLMFSAGPFGQSNMSQYGPPGMIVQAISNARLYFWNSSATSASMTNLDIHQVGAVVYLSLSDGIGWQLHDESAKELDAVATTTGVGHLVPRTFGFVRGTLSWSASTTSTSLLGQQALPATAFIEFATSKATVASSGTGLTIGTTNSATRWAAANTYTTAKKVQTIANVLPAGTAANDLDIKVVPDSASYTGSISFLFHYYLSGSTP